MIERVGVIENTLYLKMVLSTSGMVFTGIGSTAVTAGNQYKSWPVHNLSIEFINNLNGSVVLGSSRSIRLKFVC